MGDSNNVSIPDSILEQLRCAICTEYLSCAPIQVLPDGKSICGHCAPSASDGPSYRVLSLEAIVSKVSFPCKYKSYGCDRRVLFGGAREHEGACSYSGFACPGPLCSWEGPMLQLPEHFSKSHSDLVIERAEFDLDVEENKQEIVMVIVEHVSFMVKYKYNAMARDLYYDLRYFQSVKEASCKIRLLNHLDHDYSVTAKGNTCQLYDYSFNDAQLSNVLAMSSLLPALNHPNRIIVAIDLTFTQSEDEKEHNDELLKCGTCKEYLTLPFFDCNGASTCSDCCHQFCDAKLSTNAKLIKQVANSVIPCHWHDCQVAEKGDKIRKHQKECEHRIYRCIVPNCNNTFDQFGRNSHMETHPHKFFYTNCYYTMNFSNFNNYRNYFYTMTNKEIIIIKAETYLSYNFNTAREYAIHRITLKATDETDIKTAVVFRHSHCNQSKEFIVTDQFRISIDMLPDCFKPKDDLTVTIRV